MIGLSLALPGCFLNRVKRKDTTVVMVAKDGLGDVMVVKVRVRRRIHLVFFLELT